MTTCWIVEWYLLLHHCVYLKNAWVFHFPKMICCCWSFYSWMIGDCCDCDRDRDCSFVDYVAVADDEDGYYYCCSYESKALKHIWHHFDFLYSFLYHCQCVFLMTNALSYYCCLYLFVLSKTFHVHTPYYRCVYCCCCCHAFHICDPFLGFYFYWKNLCFHHYHCCCCCCCSYLFVCYFFVSYCCYCCYCYYFESRRNKRTLRSYWTKVQKFNGLASD